MKGIKAGLLHDRLVVKAFYEAETEAETEAEFTRQRQREGSSS